MTVMVIYGKCLECDRNASKRLRLAAPPRIMWAEQIRMPMVSRSVRVEGRLTLTTWAWAPPSVLWVFHVGSLRRCVVPCCLLSPYNATLAPDQFPSQVRPNLISRLTMRMTNLITHTAAKQAYYLSYLVPLPSLVQTFDDRSPLSYHLSSCRPIALAFPNRPTWS
jgi:hypothetical protein